MRTVLIAAVVLLATGCTSMDLDRTFTRNDTGSAQTSWDEWQCRRQVEDAVSTPDLIVGGVLDIGRIQLESIVRETDVAHCMESRGYQPSRASRATGTLVTRSGAVGL